MSWERGSEVAIYPKCAGQKGHEGMREMEADSGEQLQALGWGVVLQRGMRRHMSEGPRTLEMAGAARARARENGRGWG